MASISFLASAAASPSAIGAVGRGGSVSDQSPGTAPPGSISGGGPGGTKTQTATLLRSPLADGATLVGAQESAQAQTKGGDGAAGTGNSFQLSDAEKQQVSKLKKRDAEVRRHEQAHAQTGGQFAGAPSFTFERGPDGRAYAVGGEVPIDVGPIPGDPQATISKMQQVQRAALAPAKPSGQDRAIAAKAASQKLQAQAEATAQRADQFRQVAEGGDDAGGDTTDPSTPSGGAAKDIIQIVGLIA